MRLKWIALVERYIYDSREEQREHKEEMQERGFEDTGLSSAVIEENGRHYSTYAGKFRKYVHRKK